MEFNVLFTSAGRRVELMRVFRRAYETLGLAGNIVALDVDPLAPALQVVDRPYLGPRLCEPNFLPTLLDICRRERVGLVFPLIDPDIPVLAANRAQIEATNSQVSAEQLVLSGVIEERKVGQRTTLDVLTAQQDLLDARIIQVTAQRDKVVAAFSLLAATGGLDSANLGLDVRHYESTDHYRQVRDKWFGLRTPDGR